ncbi:hypothetical protein CEXT_278221 [Caerostris extrusa]|uniref:Uncharacterized protein n=1 Tax=Caerostris extrusa TaxID=172846 RepID=A0AAV4W425_CAEEX|nr:hypothetical protein CEXT_278221 [Caerostris extrusa]
MKAASDSQITSTEKMRPPVLIRKDGSFRLKVILLRCNPRTIIEPGFGDGWEENVLRYWMRYGAKLPAYRTINRGSQLPRRHSFRNEPRTASKRVCTGHKASSPRQA